MRSKLALIIAVVLGLVAVLGIRHIVVSLNTRVEQELKQVAVLAAKEPIKTGEKLGYNRWAAMMIAESSLRPDDIIFNDGAMYANEVLNRSVERGDVILKSFFTQVSMEVGTTLPPGWEAVSLRVDDVGGVAGLIRPGDHVDVIATLPLPARAGGGAGEVTTRRMLTNCTVLAVDNRTTQTMSAVSAYGRGALPYATVTLIVTPTEATLLTFVQSQGRITLALRNQTDAAEAKEPPEIGLTNARDEAARANAERKSRREAPLP